MARRKHSLKQFDKVVLQPNQLKNLKGGRKAIPAGPGSSGSFIWEGVDVRDSNLLVRKTQSAITVNGVMV